MITVGLVATLLCANWGAPSAKIVQKGLDTPVSFQSGPARLPAVLTDLGHRLGWRVTVHGSLANAIVVVSAKDKPAKELLDRLVDGIGAKWTLEDGDLNVKLGSTETAGNATLEAQHARVLAGYLKWWMASQRLDKPVVRDEPFHAMMLARTFLNGEGSVNRDQLLCDAFEILNRNPKERLTARLFDAVGPKLLAQSLGKGDATIALANLPPESQTEAVEAFAAFRQEQATWFSGLEELDKVSAASWIDKQNPAKQPPLTVNGFRMIFKKGFMPVTLQLLKGSQVVFSCNEFLPHERAVSWEAEAKPFDRNSPLDSMVPFDERSKTLARMLASRNKPLPYDAAVNKCLKELTNPLAFEPLSFGRAQLLPTASAAIKKDMVAYLDDMLVSQTMQVVPDESVPASVALNQLWAIQEGTGVREEGSWVLSGPRRPQPYLSAQFDRQALAKAVPELARPKLLTFGDYFDMLSTIGSWRGYLMGLLDTLHSGFWTMHRFYELDWVIEPMTQAERSQAMRGGINVGKLNSWAFEHVRRAAIRSIPLQGDPVETFIPDEAIRQATLRIEFSEPVEGFLVRAFYKRGGSGDSVYPPRQYCQDGYYSFHALTSAKTSEEMLARFRGGWAWPSKQVTCRVVIEVPGFRPVDDRKGEQYSADIHSQPKSGTELTSWLVKYYGK